jgi:hypothetical protein
MLCPEGLKTAVRVADTKSLGSHSMTSMPPPGSPGGDGRWSYSASKGMRAPAPEKAARPNPVTSLRVEPLSNLEPLSQQLLKVAAGLSVLLILVVAVAWLHGSGEASLNPIAEAAVHTQEQPGSRIAISGTYTLPTGQTMAMHGHGVYNGRTGLSRNVIEIAVPGPVGSIRMEGVGDENVVYMRSKLLTAGLPPGDTWMAIQPGLGGAGQASVANNTGSESQLEMLRATGADVEDLGEAEVRGVATTRYAGTVDMNRYAALLAKEGKATAAHEYEQLAKSMPAPIPVEAWLDDAGLVRQMRMVMDIPTSDGGPTVKMDMTMEFFDFGAVPKISLPSRSEAFDSTPIARASLHLLDGSATGIRTGAAAGPALSLSAFQKKTTAICRDITRRARPFVVQAKHLKGRPVAYAQQALEPIMRIATKGMRRLAGVSPPAGQQAAFQRYLRFSSISIEVNLAQTRALEIHSVTTVKKLEPLRRASARRAQRAGKDAKIGAACNESDKSSK